MDFWNDLERIIEKEYKILPSQKYSVDYLNGTIHRSRNRNPYYGIMFSLKSLGQDELCIFIEKGSKNLYYGVTILRDGKSRSASDESAYNDLAENIKDLSEWGREESWLGGNWFRTPVNFEYFADENTLKLLNPEYRQIYVQKLWAEIKGYINACKLLQYASPEHSKINVPVNC